LRYPKKYPHIKIGTKSKSINEAKTAISPKVIIYDKEYIFKIVPLFLPPVHGEFYEATTPSPEDSRPKAREHLRQYTPEAEEMR